MKAKNLDLAWQFLFEVNLGSRDMREQQEAQGVQPDYPEGPHIARVMACFNEYFPNGQKEKQATRTYSALSEFSHPNCFAFLNHFESEDLQNVSKVTFGKTPREALKMCLPSATLAFVPFIHSGGEFVGSMGNGELIKQLEQMVDEFLEYAKR